MDGNKDKQPTTPEKTEMRAVSCLGIRQVRTTKQIPVYTLGNLFSLCYLGVLVVEGLRFFYTYLNTSL